MKKAGYPSGKYTGTETFSAVSDNATQQQRVGEVAQAQFAKLGFKVKMQATSSATRCTRSSARSRRPSPPICPSVGWLKDFADPETLLDPVFNGKNILDVANSNFAQLDDKPLNAAMGKAEVINDPAQAQSGLGRVDKQVTELSPSIPWLWDTQPMLQSKNVNGVVNQANAAFDLTFTSIK